MPPRKFNQPGPSVPEHELKDIAAKSDSPEDKLREAAASAESALNSAKTASSLRSAADTIKDPAKREKYLQDAYNKEIEAHGNSKKARMLSSGAFQGSIGGGGIGMAVGAGLGTVVGTLVGTVATIPTTAVGTLVGAGVGGVHGPWVKLGGQKKDKGDDKEDDKEGQEGSEDDGEEKIIDNEMEEEVKDEADGIPDPEALRRAANEVEQQRRLEEEKGSAGRETKERRKPRKIEVRST
ncbi:hypothetical protein Ptr902_07040 [Pyrenophora tritici-repentis]|nr:hypothetical protein Ptr902_07040 [Pyrenophora tritici-repentis]